MRNGSRSEYYLVEGGIKLTRVRQSEWRRRWGIQGIVIFEEAVAVSADDGYSHSGGTFGSGIDIYAGQSAGDVYDCFARWDNVTIPAGATVSAAYIIVESPNSGNDGASMLTDLFFEASDDAIAPTDRAEHAADVRTSASTAWDAENFVVDVPTNSPDISAVVQEILDRGGWNSGQAMMLLWDDGGSPNNKYYRIYSQDTGNAPKLHVEYSA